MKVGIITFHRALNYGAQLQAYALQQYIESLGYDSSLIDYWPKYRQENIKVFSFQNFIKMSWKHKLLYLYETMFTFIRKYQRIKNTRDFVNRYFKTSNLNKYDVIVCGSDQIWRKIDYPLFHDYDETYFGGDRFQSTRKISYAASMGTVKFGSKRDESRFISLLNNFDAISVRESGLLELVNSHGIRATLVCDPVFLIGKNGWEKIIDNSMIPQEPYILYYNHQLLNITTKFVNKLSVSKNLPIIEMRGETSPFCYSSRFKLTCNAQRFISLLAGADYVVTSSFHGVALSVCLKKQFFFASRAYKSNRILSLLSTLDLLDREIGENNFHDIADKHIDYEIVSPKLNNYVQQSKLWLQENLKNEENK